MTRARYLMVWMTLICAHAAHASPQDTVSLISDRTADVKRDRNGFLLNPSWRGTKATGFGPGDACGFRAITAELGIRRLTVRDSNCLSPMERRLVTLNEASPDLGLGAICQTNSQLGELRGHVNWFPITATGRLRWVGYAGDFGADDDLTMNLYTPSPSATTSINSQVGDISSYHIEFYRKETVQRLPKVGHTWWHKLRTSLEDKERLIELTNDRFAIVNGTFNLDAVHRFHAELHPVFVMAVLIDTVSFDRGQHTTEEWALMVRNIGNQGDCSSGKLALLTGVATKETEDISIDFGWWKDAADAGARASVWEAYLPQRKPPRLPTFTTDSGTCACLQFELPRPTVSADEFTFLGTVHLDWVRKSGDGSPLLRFKELGWDPSGFPSIKVGRGVTIQWPDELSASRTAPTGLPGEATLGPALLLEAKADSLVRPIDPSWFDTPLPAPPAVIKPQKTTAVYQSIPLLGTNDVLTLKCGKRPPIDPLCLSDWRVIAVPLAWNATTNSAAASVAFYVYPHGIPKLGDFFSIPGYRLDLRYDKVHPKAVSGNAENRRVFAPELSFVWQPSSFRVTDYLAFSPYSFIGPGAAIGSSTLFGLQRGVALEVRYKSADINVEYRHNYFFGDAAESTVWSIGSYAHLPF